MKTLALLAVLGLFVEGLFMAARAEENKPLTPSITVVGSDEVSARPDMAEIQVGVVTVEQTAAKAVKENSDAMEKLFKVLAARGIASKDLRTSSFSVSPQYKRTPQGEHQPEIIAYQVSNQLQVKVRELSKLGDVLDELVAQGANNVQGISFSVAEPKPLLDEARRKAVADARRKAELYANEAGVKVGKVLLIQEQTPHLPQPMFAPMARAASVPIAPGEQEFHASITITYAIE